MDFSRALEFVRVGGGRHITRLEWNNRYRFVCYQAGYPDGVDINKNTATATGLEVGDRLSFAEYLMMCDLSKKGGTCFPWTPNNEDMMARDWVDRRTFTSPITESSNERPSDC